MKTPALEMIFLYMSSLGGPDQRGKTEERIFCDAEFHARGNRQRTERVWRNQNVHLRMISTQIRHLRITRASHADSMWPRDTLDRERRKLEARVELSDDDDLNLTWNE